jgi:hypothetical protein
MEVIMNIEQGSIEWKRIRHAKVGGSSSKGLQVKDLFGSALFHQICGEMCEDFDEYEDTYVSHTMQRGTDLEPEARKELELLKGISFIVPAWIQSDINILGVSPDAVTEDLTMAAEFKCPTRSVYNKYLLNNRLLVDEHADQIADYFASIPPLKLLYACAYRPEHKFKKLIVVEVTRDFLFNNGTEKTIKMYTIGELAEDIKVNALRLEEMCKNQIDTYKF